MKFCSMMLVATATIIGTTTAIKAANGDAPGRELLAQGRPMGAMDPGLSYLYWRRLQENGTAESNADKSESATSVKESELPVFEKPEVETMDQYLLTKSEIESIVDNAVAKSKTAKAQAEDTGFPYRKQRDLKEQTKMADDKPEERKLTTQAILSRDRKINGMGLPSRKLKEQTKMIKAADEDRELKMAKPRELKEEGVMCNGPDDRNKLCNRTSYRELKAVKERDLKEQIKMIKAVDYDRELMSNKA